MPVLLPSGFRPGPARTTVRIPVGERGGVASWRASDGAKSALFMPKNSDGESLSLGSASVWTSAGWEGNSSKEVDDRLQDLDSLRRGLLSGSNEEDDTAEESVEWPGDR